MAKGVPTCCSPRRGIAKSGDVDQQTSSNSFCFHQRPEVRYWGVRLTPCWKHPSLTHLRTDTSHISTQSIQVRPPGIGRVGAFVPAGLIEVASVVAAWRSPVVFVYAAVHRESKAATITDGMRERMLAEAEGCMSGAECRCPQKRVILYVKFYLCVVKRSMERRHSPLEPLNMNQLQHRVSVDSPGGPHCCIIFGFSGPSVSSLDPLGNL